MDWRKELIVMPEMPCQSSCWKTCNYWYTKDEDEDDTKDKKGMKGRDKDGDHEIFMSGS